MKAIIIASIFTVAVVLVQCVDEKSSSTNAPSTTTTEKPPVNCDVKPDDKDEAILLPNPKDCSSYYVCVGLTPIWMPCPEGLHFNPVLKVCDWPAAANCTIKGF